MYFIYTVFYGLLHNLTSQTYSMRGLYIFIFTCIFLPVFQFLYRDLGDSHTEETLSR